MKGIVIVVILACAGLATLFVACGGGKGLQISTVHIVGGQN